MRNFTDSGIRFEPKEAANFLISDTLVLNNRSGIDVNPQGTTSAKGTRDHVSMNGGIIGLSVAGGGANVMAVYSFATENLFGFNALIGGTIRLAHSTATRPRAPLRG